MSVSVSLTVEDIIILTNAREVLKKHPDHLNASKAYDELGRVLQSTRLDPEI